MDLDNEKWSNLPDMRYSRESHCSAVVNKKLYVIGGAG
jgi:hypothetical protein